MKTFADTGTMRDEGNLPLTIKDDKLQPHLDKASIELRKLLTDDKYDEYANDVKSDNYEILKIAEANLALSYAVTSLNIETHGSGIVRSKGWDESRSELLSQSELDKLREYYRNIAMKMVAPFLPQPEVAEDEEASEVVGSTFRMSAL